MGRIQISGPFMLPARKFLIGGRAMTKIDHFVSINGNWETTFILDTYLTQND
jgi:hypothetical protein